MLEAAAPPAEYAGGGAGSEEAPYVARMGGLEKGGAVELVRERPPPTVDEASEPLAWRWFDMRRAGEEWA
jgi:hypothetical protein